MKQQSYPQGNPRKEILDAANGYLARQTHSPKLLNARGGMASAVCIARRKMLVSNETLIAAGFHPWKLR